MNNRNKVIIVFILVIFLSLLFCSNEVKNIFYYLKLNNKYGELVKLSNTLEKELEYLENEYCILINKDNIKKDLINNTNELKEKKVVLKKDIETLNNKIKKEETKIKEIEEYLNK
ncbi:MAG: hypothetical protein IJD92_04450 [Bacilli bacterium]|nr:hypothetical protein [Bacilli bacterium]